MPAGNGKRSGDEVLSPHRAVADYDWLERKAAADPRVDLLARILHEARVSRGFSLRSPRGSSRLLASGRQTRASEVCPTSPCRGRLGYMFLPSDIIPGDVMRAAGEVG